jgi:2'-5' RNA ligase
MPAMLRVFVAVEIPAELAAACEALQSQLRQQGLRSRWVRPESLHLTLKFLGNIPAGQVPAVVHAMRTAMCGYSPMRFTAEGIGVFPSLRRPRVIWIGLSGQTAALAELQRDLDESLSAIGFRKEERAFHAHLTIGRFSEPADSDRIATGIRSYAGRTFGSFEVREGVLFQSDLRPKGPVYMALARVGLGGSR